MSGPGGTKSVRCAAALVVGMLLAGSLASCAYEDEGDPRPTAAGQLHRPAPAASTKDPGVLGVEANNYAELHKRLAEAPGPVLLSDAGAADGPGVGFTKAATVTIAGPHTVTAACVGIPHAQIYLSQNSPAGTEHTVFEVDCSRTQSQVVQLQKGYVSAQLTRPDPTGAWTGAVAGIKVTGQ
ncbi:hypothetical protein [Arthrobacter sp. 49Tsu3.1M3]|uniref:hypothetical protein n=1 Tax=Arthrobacter sp. 49Tsu3.1M3 TaxID=1279029 RepID=UPI0021185924|nr:hypothetical protein [Arthrobacter sp. 49Tsu3.1M3]